MAASNYKIGQIASRLGISVRTLRHYDGIGLLRPPYRTATGQRLYTDREIARLQKIVALRRMGFSLDHIRTILSGDAAQAYAVLDAQARGLREHIARQQDILRRVEAVLVSPTPADGSFTTSDIDALKQQFAAVRQALVLEMQRGTDPKEPHVQALVRQLEDAWHQFFGSRIRTGNFETFRGKHEPNEARQAFSGVNSLFKYLWRARA